MTVCHLRTFKAKSHVHPHTLIKDLCCSSFILFCKRDKSPAEGDSLTCVRHKGIFALNISYNTNEEKIWVWRWKIYLPIHAPSEDSDQPAHALSLIRIFTRRILDSQGCKVFSRGERRIWSDCACLFDLGLTSLSTIFQSYRDGVWMWQGAQCSLLECCLTEISRPRHFDMIFHLVTLYWHWADQF